MKKAIERELIKSINECYYKNFRDTNFREVKETISEAEMNELLVTADKIDLDLFYMVHDLFECKYGTVENPTWLSGPAIHIIQRSGMIARAVKVDIRKQSHTFGQVVNILLFSENSCLVGGAIRDLGTCREAKDYDFVTDIPYDTLEGLFKLAGFTVKETGKKFLVLNVFKDGEQYEIANFRRDQDNKGAKIGDIYEDAARRDFTVNALYYNLYTRKLVDPNGTGLRDLLNMELRFIGDPKERIIQDPLRPLRFYRFLATKDFKPHPKSLKAARRFFEYSVTNSDSTRIMNEIEKMCKI